MWVNVTFVSVFIVQMADGVDQLELRVVSSGSDTEVEPSLVKQFSGDIWNFMIP